MKLLQDNTDFRWKIWGLDYICRDGDEVTLDIKFDIDKKDVEELALNCFSGVGASYVSLDPMDFGYFDGVTTEQTSEERAILIANQICEKLGLEQI